MTKAIVAVAVASTVKALNGLRSSAIDTVKGMGVTVSRFAAICGATPDKATFASARRAAIVGFMAGHYVNKGDNRPTAAIVKYCEAAYDGRESRKVKMLADQELAYNSGKVMLTSLCKAAGVANPSNNSGAKNKGRKPSAGKVKANGKGTAPKVPTISNDNDLRAYVAIQRKAILAVVAKASQCKGLKNETTSAISDAMAILAKIAPAA